MTTTSRQVPNTHARAEHHVVVPFPVPKSDIGLVGALRANHPEALRALCQRHSHEMLLIAAGILGPDPYVEQLVVDTLRRSLGRLQELRDARALRPWLLKELVAGARQRIRARQRWRWLGRRSTVMSHLASDQSEQLLTTYRVLDRMHVNDRLVFCLVVIQTLELAEAAAVLGVSVSVVRRTTALAHASFSRHLRRVSRAPIHQSLHYPTLGREIVEENARLLGSRGILEFDVLTGRYDQRLEPRHRGRHWIVWAVAVAPLFFVLSSGAAALASYLSVVKLQVHGRPVAPDAFDELGYLVAAPPQKSEVVTFSDGSTIHLEPGSRLRVLGANHRGGRWALESGSARVCIAGSRRTEHRVAAGPFALSLPTGQADVSWDPAGNELSLVVYQGSVMLSGCQFGAGNAVATGNELRATCVAQ